MTNPEDNIRRMSTAMIDNSIDRMKKDIRTLEEELALLEAERARRMSAMNPLRKRANSNDQT
jgi:hypothetical protein